MSRPLVELTFTVKVYCGYGDHHQVTAERPRAALTGRLGSGAHPQMSEPSMVRVAPAEEFAVFTHPLPDDVAAALRVVTDDTPQDSLMEAEVDGMWQHYVGGK